MNTRTQTSSNSGPEPSRSRYSPAAQVLGCLLGSVWFTSLALSGDERPGWLRAAYAVAALVFATGAGATAVARFREWRRRSTVR